VSGATFLVDPVDLPRTEIELEATYGRASPEGGPARPTAAPALRDVLVTSGDPSPIAALDPRALLAASSAALVAGRADDAEDKARSAILADPTLAAAWIALGEAMLQEHHVDEAVVPLEHARVLAPDSGEPLVVLAEAHLEAGRLKESRALAKEAKSKKLSPAELERVQRLLGE
jgi:predicted Zn-dependent protease